MDGQKEIDAALGKPLGKEAGPNANDIYTMPKEFFVPMKHTSKRILGVVVIAAVVLAVFGAAAAYVLLTNQGGGGQEEALPAQQAVTNEQPSSDQPISPVEEDTTVIEQPDTDSETNFPQDSEEPAAPTETVEALRPSVDLDGDGLTDIEESLLGIDPALPDTDDDGFFDLGGIGVAIAGVPFAAVLTALMFMLAIAQIGAAPVLALVAAWLYWQGETGWAIALLAWTVVVGSLDNVLRPFLIRRGADLPLLLIFAGVIGGLLAYGVVGIFIGPVVLAVAYKLLEVWLDETPD